VSALPEPNSELEVEYVDAERGLEIFDAQARKHLGMSGPEFVRRYKSGQLQDLDSELVFRVATLLPFAGNRSLFGMSPSQVLRHFIDTMNRTLSGIATGRLSVSPRPTKMEATKLTSHYVFRLASYSK
jgi:hypothetical protein